MVDLVVELIDRSEIEPGAYVRRSRCVLCFRKSRNAAVDANVVQACANERSVYSRRTRLRNILSGYTYVGTLDYVATST